VLEAGKKLTVRSARQRVGFVPGAAVNDHLGAEAADRLLTRYRD